MHQEIDPDKSHLEEIEGYLCRGGRCWEEGWRVEEGGLVGVSWENYASASSGYLVLEKAIDLLYVRRLYTGMVE